MQTIGWLDLIDKNPIVVLKILFRGDSKVEKSCGFLSKLHISFVVFLVVCHTAFVNYKNKTLGTFASTKVITWATLCSLNLVSIYTHFYKYDLQTFQLKIFKWMFMSTKIVTINFSCIFKGFDEKLFLIIVILIIQNNFSLCLKNRVLIISPSSDLENNFFSHL